VCRFSWGSPKRGNDELTIMCLLLFLIFVTTMIYFLIKSFFVISLTLKCSFKVTKRIWFHIVLQFLQRATRYVICSLEILFRHGITRCFWSYEQTFFIICVTTTFIHHQFSIKWPWLEKKLKKNIQVKISLCRTMICSNLPSILIQSNLSFEPNENR
jgi:hypothetical protein